MNKQYMITMLSLLSISLLMPSAFAFDVNLLDISVKDASVTEYPEYDIITAVFSIFNGNTHEAFLNGHNMLYLNDTNSDWWEYVNHNDFEQLSEINCSQLDVSIDPGNSTDVNLCFLVQHDPTIGYSLIVNNDENLMDIDVKEFSLESVPDFFKTIASSYCSDTISESEFINSAQTYIQSGTINVLRGQSTTDIGVPTPLWIKTNACDWSNDSISDYEFLDGIYWLIDNGKIQLE